MNTSVVLNGSLLDLRPTQQEGTHAWYWKPSQQRRTGDIMDLGGEPTPTVLQNQQNF